MNIKIKSIFIYIIISILFVGCINVNDINVSVEGGRYRIDVSGNTKTLFDDKDYDNSVILDDVRGYYDDGVSKLYVKGRGVYIIIDYVKEEYIKYHSLDGNIYTDIYDEGIMDKKDQEVFLSDDFINYD